MNIIRILFPNNRMKAKLDSIYFKNFKAFKENQHLELRPITILIGKNSSGKSAITKLPLLLSKSFDMDAVPPIKIRFDDIEFGGTFSDLIFNKFEHGSLAFSLNFSTDSFGPITVTFQIQNFYNSPIQAISKWSISSSFLTLDLELDLEKYQLNSTVDLLYSSQRGPLLVNFRGLIPIELKHNHESLFKEELVTLSTLLHEWSKSINYIGPFRALPERLYRHMGQVPNKIGHKGEFAPQILGINYFLDNNLIKSVGDWYQKCLGGWKLDVLNTVNSFEIVLISPDNPEVKVNIVDVGQGMSQVFPLIVRCFGKNFQNNLDIIEQPELHLHPAAHAELSELFALTAIRESSTFIIETHSENFILRIRRLIVEKRIKSENVIIYWVDDETRPGSHLNKILISDDGLLTDWPSGVFSEDHEEVLAIKKAARK